MTTPETRRPAAWRPGRRVRWALLAMLATAGLAWGVATWTHDDDAPVDATTPEARRATAVALGVVPGRVLGVYRDEDDGKWEVKIAQAGREYEVELAPGDLSLLRLDYD
jgi:hypothetical protein